MTGSAGFVGFNPAKSRVAGAGAGAGSSSKRQNPARESGGSRKSSAVNPAQSGAFAGRLASCKIARSRKPANPGDPAVLQFVLSRREQIPVLLIPRTAQFLCTGVILCTRYFLACEHPSPAPVGLVHLICSLLFPLIHVVQVLVAR